MKEIMNTNRKKILLAVDGSYQSLEAVRYVSKIFPPQAVEVVLFHVMSKIPEFFYDLGKQHQYHQTILDIRGWEWNFQDLMNKFISKAHQILIDSGIPDEAIIVDIHERKEGIARDIIVESSHGYSTIVVGRSGISKFKDFIIGSVANKLIENIVHVPIYVVGGKPKQGKLLLALDKSEAAMRAVDYVGTMLDGSPFEVTLFHVVRGFNIFEQRFEDLLASNQEKKWIEEGKSEMEPVFEAAKTCLLKKGLDPKCLTTKVITGVSSRSGAIVKEAKEGRYGTIVVGRKGLSKVKKFLMGRVSTKVIQLARTHAVCLVG